MVAAKAMAHAATTRVRRASQHLLLVETEKRRLRLAAVEIGHNIGRFGPLWAGESDLIAPVTAAYKSNRAAGPAIASHAMRAALARAREHGVGVVTAIHCAHFGAASAYAAMALPDSMFVLVMCNSAPVVAPYGGATPLHGTNPIAYAAPGHQLPPIVLDVATSTVASGQLTKAARRGQEIPLGWALAASLEGAGIPRDLTERFAPDE